LHTRTKPAAASPGGGRDNILKRLLVHAAAFNISLLLRQRTEQNDHYGNDSAGSRRSGKRAKACISSIDFRGAHGCDHKRGERRGTISRALFAALSHVKQRRRARLAAPKQADRLEPTCWTWITEAGRSTRRYSGSSVSLRNSAKRENKTRKAPGHSPETLGAAYPSQVVSRPSLALFLRYLTRLRLDSITRDAMLVASRHRPTSSLNW
jgi:hypothetical protein